MFTILALDYEEYRGHPLDFLYRTKHYLTMEAVTNIDGRIFKLAPKSYLTETEKQFTATLGAEHLHAPHLLAAKTGDIIKGYIEIDWEAWNNRMRITNLLVLPPYRGQGVGTALMHAAIAYATSHNARAMVLETQSCNTPALSFYAHHGFDIIGFDLTHYSNNDVEQNEFRIEMGRSLQ